MDSNSEIFVADYQRLQELVRHYPAITIASAEKDPPDQYVIEYRLLGYGLDANGDVQVARRHRVQINLPFGYPHFPPIVKPLSRIFHPDIDETVVRIADYWQSNPSLADLVVHIGHMIRGEVYNTEIAFNRQAAAWYVQQGEKLPLAGLEYIRDPDAQRQRARSARSFPLKGVAAVVLVLLAVVLGGFSYRDTQSVSKASANMARIEQYMADRKFPEARQLAEKTLESLRWGIFWGKQRAKSAAAFKNLLASSRMQEGLQGRVLSHGKFIPFAAADAWRDAENLRQSAADLMAKGEIDEAEQQFSQALKLAQSHNLEEVAARIHRTSAETRLAYYLQLANSAYGGQQWRQAASGYDAATAILKAEHRYLTDLSAGKLAKVVKLDLLAHANLEISAAQQAEENGDYGAAADHNRSIVSAITASGYGADPSLAPVLAHARQEIDRLDQQALIANKTEYLLTNYKEIFIAHYPGIDSTSLRSPKVRFSGYSRGNLVFLMSCIELIQNRSNEYRLYYQYNPARDKWSIYTEGD